MSKDDTGDDVDGQAHAAETHPHDQDDPFDKDYAHYISSRRWFASSAFPMIAGTLGPVASAFSICALVRPWRQMWPPGSDVDTAMYIPDPSWYVPSPAARTIYI
jgi:potassium channel subfamily K